MRCEGDAALRLWGGGDAVHRARLAYRDDCSAEASGTQQTPHHGADVRASLP